MKIYKIAQENNEAERQEVYAAIYSLNMSIASINESLEQIEQSNMTGLFSRDGMIRAIQNGDLNRIDVNLTNQALEAMANISRAIPSINKALQVVQANATIANAMDLDFNSIQKIMVTSLQSGDYQQFQGALARFQNVLPGITGTK